MPTLTVNGHQVSVDDSFLKLSPDEQNSTVDEIAKSLPAEKPSGVFAGLREGTAHVLHGAGETAKQFFGADNTATENAANKVAPSNYKPAEVIPEGGHWYDPRTYNVSQIPQAVAEAAPGMVTDIAAAKLGSKVHPLLGVGAGLASYLLRTRGDAAKQDAVIRTGDANAEPETQDKVRSLATGAAESVPQALGIGRFLPGGAVSKTAGQALAKLGITAATEGGAGAASNAISQAGSTVGTPGGLKVDPNKVAESGIVSAVTGAGLAAPKAMAERSAAKTYGKFDGDNEKATAAYTNRINEALDGRKVTPENSFDAMRDVHEATRDELKTAVKPIKDTLEPEVADALKRAGKGRKLSDSDLQSIEENTSPDIAFLARQAHVGAMAKELGDYGQGKFIGGMANAVGKHIRAIQNPAGAGVSAALGAAGLGGHAASLFAYGPATLAAITGGYLGMRGIDSLTGNRTPLKGLLDRYSNSAAPVRLPAPVQAPEPTPAPMSGPTGPKVGFNPGVAGGGTALALGQNPFAPKPEAAPKPFDPAAQNADIQGMLRMAMARRNVAAQQAAASAPAPAPGVDANAMNTQVKAALEGYAARQKWAARRAALGIGEDSPLVQDNGGIGLLGTRNLGKEMSALVSAARVHEALTRQPEEEGAPQGGPAPAPAPQMPSPPTAPEAPVAPVSPGGGPAPEPAPAGPAPVDPLVLAARAAAKITKKNGKVKQEAPQETPFEHAYEPMTGEQLWGRGLTDETFIAREIAREKNSGKDIADENAYGESIKHDREKRRNILADIAGDHEADGDVIANLLEELHHTRRAAKAHAAIQHFTKLMSPEAAARVKARLDRSYINSTWTK